MIRVLVAEDSVTVRRLLVELLRAAPDIEVIGEAGNGEEAVEMTKRLRPDLVTMDVHMPVLDGLEATKRIMVEAPTPIVIVSHSADVRGVEVSLSAIRAGALAVVPKPVGPASPSFEEDGRRLIETVRAMSQVRVVRRWRARPAWESATKRSTERLRLVAIAASTGGPAALAAILSALPVDFPAPILLVQHMAAGFVTGLAGWLNTAGRLQVKVAEDGEPLAAGTAYLPPDGRHLGVADREHVLLSEAPPIGGFRPSATFLFQSAASTVRAACAAVVLTGMGEDGVEGLRAAREWGCRVLAQDEETSVVWGMPGAAARAGLADEVLPLGAIAPRLVDLA